MTVAGEENVRWNLDEGEGDTAFDLSGNNHHGDIVGATWTNETYDDIPPPDLPEAKWSWAGSVTTTSATVKGGRSSTPPDLVVSASDDFQDTWQLAPSSITEGGALGEIAEYHLEGLEAGTTYYYRWADQEEAPAFGRFHTMPERAGAFTIAFSACADTGSEHEIFDVILSHDPMFFIHMGDIFYEDIAVNDVDRFYDAYQQVLIRSDRQNRFFRQVHIPYMLDDHDYGPNNSDMTAPGREAALASYRSVVPHYPLALGDDPEAPVGQAFSAGRIRFIMPDLRSQRTPNSVLDGPAKTMMGHEQREWVQNEMLAARDEYALIVLMSGVPWISPPGGHSDSWASFARERRVIGEFMMENAIDNVLMIAGDAHMVGGDDGSNNTYSRPSREFEPGPGFPVFHAAAMDRGGSVKGGPYSHPTFPGGGQYGLLHVDDDGEEIKVTFEGRHYEDGVLLEMDFKSATRTFASWTRAHFSKAEQGEDDAAGVTTDPAGDGVANLLKYAFGINPARPVSREDLPITEIEPGSGQFRITYPERVAARDITYVTQVSTDLYEWTTIEAMEFDRQPHPKGNGFDLVTIGADSFNESRRAFVRIKVLPTMDEL